jgi:hypothetical protein
LRLHAARIRENTGSEPKTCAEKGKHLPCCGCRVCKR